MVALLEICYFFRKPKSITKVNLCNTFLNMYSIQATHFAIAGVIVVWYMETLGRSVCLWQCNSFWLVFCKPVIQWRVSCGICKLIHPKHAKCELLNSITKYFQNFRNTQIKGFFFRRKNSTMVTKTPYPGIVVNWRSHVSVGSPTQRY